MTELMIRFPPFLALLLLIVPTFCGAGPVVLAEPVSFSRDILPILSDRCFHCHGPDEGTREADLRLDRAENALVDRGGYVAIAPGDPALSLALERITTDDPELRMPPEDSHRKPLTEKEIELVRTWIREGAPWGKHWSFEPIQRPAVPNKDVHPIDWLVRERLEPLGLQQNRRALLSTLLRRLSFDLTGLPPTRDEAKAWAALHDNEGLGAVIDRLLESPHYGERMAMWWLDAARYSDTDGYQGDATRENWPWRDWVVDSFNANQPFDRFTIEQFAGDLLPDATPEQILATCFHRNHMTNGEGGRDPEESRVDYVIDRVNTVGTVWLGLTLGCAQCHSHKFDPVSQHDYYSLTAFFNSIDEDGKAGNGAKPFLKYKSTVAQPHVDQAQDLVDSRRQELDRVRTIAEAEFEPWLESKLHSIKAGFEGWHPLRISQLESVEGTLLHPLSHDVVLASGPNPVQDDYRIVGTSDLARITGLRLEIFADEAHTHGLFSRGATGEFILTDVKLQLRRRGESQLRDIELASAVADAEKDVKGRAYGKVADTLDDDPRNGWMVPLEDHRDVHTAVFALAQPLVLADDEELVFVMLHRSTDGDSNIGRFRVSVTDQPGSAVRSLEPMPLKALAESEATVVAEIDAGLRKKLLEQFLVDHGAFQTAQSRFDAANRQLNNYKKKLGEMNVMVLAERSEPRKTFVLNRGVWDDHGDEVSRAFPQQAVGLEVDAPTSRLDLAEWLVHAENPLTARVVVNQLWQLCFGSGLVRTPDDFGLQGELPTHPKLLDWLASEFIASGWDVKHTLRLIVTSHTYQQSSDMTEEQLELDPENRLLARGARFRLPSWMIRDAALRSSGLMNPIVGGPPAMPYQPAGVWREMFMGRFNYEPSQGPTQFRRTAYAFWRRSAAPTFLFDSAQRRVCEVRPRRTNTPLQALTLLNDLTLLEASRELAKRSIAISDQLADRVRWIFESILSRSPDELELKLLLEPYRKSLAHYQKIPDDAARFLDFGQPENSVQEHACEVAALTIVASLVYNLDESMTHE